MLAAIAVALLEAGILTYPPLGGARGRDSPGLGCRKGSDDPDAPDGGSPKRAWGRCLGTGGLGPCPQGSGGGLCPFYHGAYNCSRTLTFGGSAVAAAKLHGVVSQRPQELPRHAAVVTVVTVLSLASLFFAGRTAAFVQLISSHWSLESCLPCGWASDMPITISLLNSLSGVAGAIAGFPLRIRFWWQWAGLLGPLGLS